MKSLQSCWNANMLTEEKVCGHPVLGTVSVCTKCHQFSDQSNGGLRAPLWLTLTWKNNPLQKLAFRLKWWKILFDAQKYSMRHSCEKPSPCDMDKNITGQFICALKLYSILTKVRNIEIRRLLRKCIFMKSSITERSTYPLMYRMCAFNHTTHMMLWSSASSTYLIWQRILFVLLGARVRATDEGTTRSTAWATAPLHT